MFHRSRTARIGATVAVALTLMGVAGACTRPSRPPATTPTTDSHGHTADDHANMTTTTMMDHSMGDMDHGDHGH